MHTEIIQEKISEEYWFAKLLQPASGNSLFAGMGRKAHGAAQQATLPPQVVQGIRELARHNRRGEYVLYLSVFAFLLNKFFRERQWLVAAPAIAGEEQAADALLFHLLQVDAQWTFRQYIERVAQEVQQDITHGACSWKQLHNRLADRRIEEQAVLSIGFCYQPLQPVACMPETSLQFTLYETENEQVEVSMTAHNGSVSDGLAREFINRYILLAGALPALINTKLGEADWVTPEERHRILHGFNHTATPFPHKTLTALFEEQARRNGAQVALVAGAERYTYDELNRLSNRLAHHLRNACDAGREALVAVLLDRSTYTGVAILGILKAGAAFLTIDPQYPAARIQAILADANASVLITRSDYFEKLEGYEGGLFAMDVELSMLHTPDTDPDAVNDAADMAYVLYTSGTTGMPKGAVNTHQAVVNLVTALQNEYLTNVPPLNMAVVAAYVFDPFWKQFFLALLHGHTLFIVPETLKKNAADLWRYYSSNHIQLTDGTPSLLNILTGHLPAADLPLALQYFMIGGEPMAAGAVLRLHEYFSGRGNGIQVINEYGLTECCVDNVCCFVNATMVQGSGPIPIGKPLPNNQVLVLDNDRRLAPPGIRGEIAILGTGVGRGYLNRPGLTADRFVPCAYPELTGPMYLTGDAGYWLPDGNIVCSGRFDAQMKVNGYRVEPGEIERAVMGLEGIAAAKAVAVGDADSRSIALYYTASHELQAAGIRQFLAGALPAWMVPSYYIPLKRFPLTVNGKIDVRALPDPVSGGDEAEYTAPKNDMEQLLAGIWQQVLRVPRISTRSDFFLKGGDSIRAIRISSQLHSAGYKMEVRDIFQYPTIEQLARHITQLKRTAAQEPVTGNIPLTPVQHAFFRHHRAQPAHYNQSVLLRYDTLVEVSDIEQVFTVLQAHHDALRITFSPDANGGWLQQNHAPYHTVQVNVFDLRAEADAASMLRQYATAIQQNIDLQNGPLFRLALFHMHDGSRLLIAIHHLVTDTVSFRILISDMNMLHEQLEKKQALQLPLKTDSYQRWATSLHTYASGAPLRKEWAFWNQQEALLTRLAKTHVPYRLCDVETRSFTLETAETHLLLHKASMAFRTNVQDLLLTAFVLAWKDLYGEEQLGIALEGHGRQLPGVDVDVSRTVGWFTSIYPVVTDLSEVKALADCIVAVKECIRRVPANGIGYGVLKYLTTSGEEPARQSDALPAVMFNYLGQLDLPASGNRWRIAEESAGSQHSGDTEWLWQVEINAFIAEDRLTVNISRARQEAGHEADLLPQFFQSRLQEIIRYCAARNGQQRTPSDFTWKGMKYGMLQTLCNRFDIEDIYPLSPMQEGILFTCLYSGEATAYFEQFSYRVRDAQMDPERVRESLARLIRRHGILRTLVWYTDVERPVHILLRHKDADFYFEDLRGYQQPAEYVRQYKEKDRRRGFDLQSDMLLRVAVFRIAEDEYELVWSHHHMLMDAWCQGILINEYYIIYNSLLHERPVSLPDARPYAEYIRWLEQQDKEAAIAWWRDYLGGFEKPTPLPKRIKQQNPREGAKKRMMLQCDEKLTESINEIPVRYQVTLNTLMQCAWAILPARYNNTRDVVFGSVVAGRPAALPGADTMVGLFINTIPVRIRYEAQTSFAGLMKQVQEQALQGEPHHHINLAEIQSVTALQLLDHILLFDNYPSTEQQLEGKQAGGSVALPDIYQVEVFEKPAYDLNIRIMPGERLAVYFDYNDQVYDAATIASLQHALKRILTAIASDPECTIDDMAMLSEEEERNLNALAAGLPATAPYGGYAEWFGQNARQFPDAVALFYKDKQYTYAALQQKAGALAGSLCAQFCVGPGQVIGVLMQRSDLLVVTILAIMQTGAAFMPIETGLPAERKAFLLRDAGVRLLITGSDCLMELSAYYEGDVAAIDLVDFTAPPPANVPADAHRLAYVLYTSGSTGQPKGVGIESGSLMNYLHWANTYYFNNRRGHCFGLFTPLSFDLTITALLSGFLRGDALVVADAEPDMVELLTRAFSDNRINTLKITPSHIRIIEKLPLRNTPVQTVILGGEKVTAHDIAVLQRLNPSMRIFNEYGPTETTVGCTAKEITGASDVQSVGTPVFNASVYILDSRGRQQPPGAEGEIFVGGAGVARGYLNRPALTADRFAPMPAADGMVLYRTGDLGRRSSNGEIEYIGRADGQVKVRGYRVETGEVEHAVQQLPGIGACVVTVVADAEGNNELACYYSGNGAIGSDMLRSQLAARLPAFMVPDHFIWLAEIPVTPNGKTDKKRLPAPGKEQPQTVVPFEAAGNTIEEQLEAIWNEVLDRPRTGIHENFFTLGGNSLKIVRLYDRIQQSFATPVKVSELFDNPTISRQARIIAERRGTAAKDKATLNLIDF